MRCICSIRMYFIDNPFSISASFYKYCSISNVNQIARGFEQELVFKRQFCFRGRKRRRIDQKMKGLFDECCHEMVFSYLSYVPEAFAMISFVYAHLAFKELHFVLTICQSIAVCLWYIEVPYNLNYLQVFCKTEQSSENLGYIKTSI